MAPCPADIIRSAEPDNGPFAALMPLRLRKLIGTVALMALITLWALLAMVAAQALLPNAGAFAAALYYLVAGLGWLAFAMPLVAWMSRP